VSAWFRRRRNGPRIELALALGAFPRPGGDISPLFVLFEVTNAGETDATISRLYVTPRGERTAVFADAPDGDRPLPCVLRPGESARFRVRAKALANDLKRSGHGGRPRLRLVVEDGTGGVYERGFVLRVDDYLDLQDD
jgi:hypothetical protein